MDDLISREEAIEAVYQVLKQPSNGEIWQKVQESLMQIPSSAATLIDQMFMLTLDNEDLNSRISYLENYIEDLEQYKDSYTELEALYFLRAKKQHGRWIPGREISRDYNIGDSSFNIQYENWRCSNCNCVSEDYRKPAWNYCPNCGSRNGDSNND